MRSRHVTSVLLTLFSLLSCALAVRGSLVDGAAGDEVTVYYVNTLLPGKGSVPPQFVLSHDRASGELVLRSLPSNRMERAAQRIAAALRLVPDRVPRERHDLCRFPDAPETLTIRVSPAQPEGVIVGCMKDLFSHFSMDKLLSSRAFHQSVSDGQRYPLSTEVDGECSRIPFSLAALDIYVVQDGDAIVVLDLWDESRHLAPARCTAWFEVRREVKSEGDHETVGRKSFIAPVVMLVLVVTIRSLPRYLLTRRGQLDRDSYKGTVPTLSSARLAELKKQQRDLIARMKEEDARNGLLKKTE